MVLIANDSSGARNPEKHDLSLHEVPGVSAPGTNVQILSNEQQRMKDKMCKEINVPISFTLYRVKIVEFLQQNGDLIEPIYNCRDGLQSV
jgi:hypothetical protein